MVTKARYFGIPPEAADNDPIRYGEAFPELAGGWHIGEHATVRGLNKPFWAKLTAFDGSKYYAWTEQSYMQPPGTSTGAFYDLPGGQVGTFAKSPALEPNGVTLTVPTFVRLQYAYFDPLVGDVHLILIGAGSNAVTLRVPNDGEENVLVAAFVESWVDGNPPTPSDGASCWAYGLAKEAVSAGIHIGVELVAHSDGLIIYGVQSGETETLGVCLADQTIHTLTFVNGRLVEVV